MSAEQTPDIAAIAAVIWAHTGETCHDRDCGDGFGYHDLDSSEERRRGCLHVAQALAPVLDAAVREAEQRGRAAEREAWAHIVRDHDHPPNKDRRGYDYRMGWWDAVLYANQILTRGLGACVDCPGYRARADRVAVDAPEGGEGR